ncbi:HAD family hydrolase [Peribacillus deserti]|nr:HAD family hydrolase [Peribacillus deserti]
MFRIVFIDIDGTLLNSKEELNENLLKTIQELQQKGVLVALATGRSLDGSIIHGKQFNCSIYVTYNGGYSILNNHIIHDAKIPAELAYFLCRTTHDLNGTFIHFSDRRSLSNRPGMKTEYLLPFAESSTIIDTNRDAHRLALYLDSKHRNELQTQISEAASFDEGDRLEVFPAGSKWTGILPVIKKLGISPEEVVTIGNGTNDIEMLMEAGLGIAMGNSPDCVKQAADWVTEDNDHDGAALALQKAFSLQKEPLVQSRI